MRRPLVRPRRGGCFEIGAGRRPAEARSWVAVREHDTAGRNLSRPQDVASLAEQPVANDGGRPDQDAAAYQGNQQGETGRQQDTAQGKQPRREDSKRCLVR
jgi:hypothetical protein